MLQRDALRSHGARGLRCLRVQRLLAASPRTLCAAGEASWPRRAELGCGGSWLCLYVCVGEGVVLLVCTFGAVLFSACGARGLCVLLAALVVLVAGAPLLLVRG